MCVSGSVDCIINERLAKKEGAKQLLHFQRYVFCPVELEGVEPSSKQGNHTLSTCLFQSSFSCHDKS